MRPLRFGMSGFNRCEARVGDGCRCQAQSRVIRAEKLVCMRHARLFDMYLETNGESDARERLELGRSAMTALPV